MPRFAVEVHPLAADEAEAAERWYRERNETAAARFRRELASAVERIAERPEAGAPYLREQSARPPASLPFLHRVPFPPSSRRSHGCRTCAPTARLLAGALVRYAARHENLVLVAREPHNGLGAPRARPAGAERGEAPRSS